MTAAGIALIAGLSSCCLCTLSYCELLVLVLSGCVCAVHESKRAG